MKNKEVVIREGEYGNEAKIPEADYEQTSGYEEIEIKTSKNKNIKKTIIILSVALIAFITYLASDYLSRENFSLFLRSNFIGAEIGEGFPVEISGSSVNTNNIDSYDTKLAVISDTNFFLINSTGDLSVEFLHNFSEPIMVSAGARHLIYDVGEKKYVLISDDNKIIEMQTEYPINVASIADNGTYAIVTQEDSYSSTLYVYTADSQLKYRFDFSTSYVTSLALNDDGSFALVACADSEEAKIFSKIYALDFTNVDPVHEYESQDNLIIDVAYNGRNNYYMIGDTSTVYYNGSTFEEYGYEGKRLTSFDGEGENVLLSLSEYSGGGECEVHILDGINANIVQLDGTVEDISSHGISFAVLVKNNIYSYHLNGSLISSTETDNDTKSIALCDEKRVYVLGIKNINFIELN